MAQSAISPLAVREGPRRPAAATIDGVEPTEAARSSRVTQDEREWIAALRGDGPARDQATERLHELLLRAARFEISRRRAAMPHVRGGDFDDLAQQAASDALMAILAKLDDFRGESRFVTWAYKFALLEAAVRMRRRAWQGRELPVEPERWLLIPDSGGSPSARLEHRERLGRITEAIQSELTPRQREILLAVSVQGVPIDVMAERLGTTRGALYKVIHDARKKLRASLGEEGIEWQAGEEVRDE